MRIALGMSLLLALASIGCTTAPQAPPPPASTASTTTTVDAAQPTAASSTPTDTAIATEETTEQADSDLCDGNRPHTEIPLDQHYAATVQGEGQVPISTEIGAAPGASYGIGGESVIALSFGYDDSCQQWLKLKWEASDFTGWLARGTQVELLY